MLNDHRQSYHWQDHVITPRRATLNLLATALIVVVVSAAGFARHAPAPAAHARITTEQTPSLAQSVKPPVSPHPQSADPRSEDPKSADPKSADPKLADPKSEALRGC
jgi:hypothetical protein